MRDHSLGLDIDGATRLVSRQAEVDVVEEGQKLLVEGADSLERAAAHQHAVELDEIDGLATQLRKYVRDRAVDVAMLLVQVSLSVVDDAQVRACRVNGGRHTVSVDPVAIERADRPGAGLLPAAK